MISKVVEKAGERCVELAQDGSQSSLSEGAIIGVGRTSVLAAAQGRGRSGEI